MTIKQPSSNFYSIKRRGNAKSMLDQNIINSIHRQSNIISLSSKLFDQLSIKQILSQCNAQYTFNINGVQPHITSIVITQQGKSDHNKMKRMKLRSIIVLQHDGQRKQSVSFPIAMILIVNTSQGNLMGGRSNGVRWIKCWCSFRCRP